MAQSNRISPPGALAPLDPLPAVRLELHHGSARPVVYEVSDLGFLIGSVPGCDLRLPGTGLPPVICLITRHASGATLRKLVPTQTVLLNGNAPANGSLVDGDRLRFGAVEVLVHLTPLVEAQSNNPEVYGEHGYDRVSGPGEGDRLQQEREMLAVRSQELEALARQLDLRGQQLDEQTQELETDRVIWYRRREEIEKECQERVAFLSSQRHGEQPTASVPVQQAAEPAHPEQDLVEREEKLLRQQQELAGLRQELAEIRRQLYDRYRERRDRLAGLQEAVNRAAGKVQERKRQVDAECEQNAVRVQELQTLQAELEKRQVEAADKSALLDERDRLLCSREEELHSLDSERRADGEAREQRLARDREALQKNQAQYQADLARLDRLQAVIGQRQQQLQQRAREVDQRFEQLQRTSRELEEQARHLSESHDKLRAEETRLAQQKAQQDAAAGQLAQRTTTLEGQQAMLASLRTRLERMREELRREQQRVAEQQARLNDSEAQLQQQLQESQRLRAELDSTKELGDQERRQIEQRRTILEAAVVQLRQAQEALAAKEKELDQRAEALDSGARKQAEERRQLQANSEQLREMQQRLAADRQVFREREASLAQTEQAREALQEQLRRRAEELAARQRSLAEQAGKQDELVADVERRRAEIGQDRKEMDERLAALQQQFLSQTAELEQQRSELLQREERYERQVQRLKETGRKVGAARKSLHQERSRWLAEHHESQEATARASAELQAARRGVLDLQRQLPELMLRAHGAAERLAGAREQLREHLRELHAYAQQSQEAADALRSQVLTEAGQVQEQQQALHGSREEHRLAVAAFRQQLIEWQGQLTDLRKSLAQGETRLERRQAQVDQQARQIDATTTRLAEQAEQLQAQERVVVERSQEIERHLHDMREWYRRKLRELSLVRCSPEAVAGHTARDSGRTPPCRDILTLTPEVEPPDRKLGELLLSLDLVDSETLAALLVEAGRQHRSLRQALLAGGYLTLYQMALIETGDLDGLVLGPLRVIDRLRVTPCEAVYRVFDPRRNQEALFRHLVEAEMEDAVRPDEFRQRFGQAATVRHPHVAVTLEVLEINGRPGVLQEWLPGLPSSDWPPLAAVPGVWFRLLSQAALGLQAAHQAGLIHGHLEPGSFVLNGEGIVKLCGLGEPLWLLVPPRAGQREESADADLAELGRIAAGWAALATPRKDSKTKRLTEALQALLDRFTAEPAERRYPSISALLEDLQQAAADAPRHEDAWERLLQQIGVQAVEDAALRQSA